MGYTIAICDDDKAMADKLTASLKNEFMKTKAILTMPNILTNLKMIQMTISQTQLSFNF